MIRIFGKGNEREVFMVPVLSRALEQLPWKSISEYVFHGWQKNKAKGKKADRTLYRWFVPLFREAGIEGGQGAFHRLRHTAASVLADMGHSAEEIAALLGHVSPEITLRYMTVGQERIKQLGKALDKNASQTFLANSSRFRPE